MGRAAVSEAFDAALSIEGDRGPHRLIFQYFYMSQSLPAALAERGFSSSPPQLPKAPNCHLNATICITQAALQGAVAL